MILAAAAREYFLWKDPCGVFLLIWSVATVALIVERVIMWLRLRGRAKAMARQLGGLLAKPEREQLKQAFARSGAPLAQVMTHVLKHETHESPETTLLLLDDALEDVESRMKKYLVYLAALAGTGPFLGLLGTVLGIIETFTSIARSGVSNPTVISYGIGQALWTTAVGLMIAIPAYIAYNILTSRADGAIRDLRTQANRIFVALGDL